MVGRVDRLDLREAIATWKERHRPFVHLYIPKSRNAVARRCVIGQDHGWKQALDHKMIDTAREAIDNGRRLSQAADPHVIRTVGTMLIR